MLLQFLADASRDLELLEQYVVNPDEVLRRYPGIAKVQRAILDSKNIEAVALSVASEVQAFFGPDAIDPLYTGFNISLISLDPDSAPVGRTLEMTLLLKAERAPILRGLRGAVSFSGAEAQVEANVTETSYDAATRRIKVGMTARFETPGWYQARVRVDGNSPDSEASAVLEYIFEAVD